MGCLQRRMQGNGKRQPVTRSSERTPVTVKATKPNSQGQETSIKCGAQLIGKQCMVPCSINGVPLQMLLGSGAQVTMVGTAWIEKAVPSVKIMPLASLFPDQTIEISAANGTRSSLEGWAEIDLQIHSVNHGHVRIQVPIVISQDCNHPLLGSHFRDYQRECRSGR